MPKCKFADTVTLDGTDYCVCTAMYDSERLAQYAGVDRMVSGGIVTGSQNYTGNDTNWWNRCAVGKGHKGITPSRCGYYQRAVRNGVKPVPKSKSSPKPKASKSTASSRKVTQNSPSYSKASTPSAGASGRVHPDTASIGTVVGKIALAAIALTIVIVLIGVVTDFFGGLFGGQSDPISLPTHGNQEAVATQPPTNAPITETPEERAIREVYEFRPVALSGVTLGNFLESISPSGEWDIRFGTEVTFEGETELGWLELFVWNINIETNQIGLGIQLDGVGISLDEFLELF